MRYVHAIGIPLLAWEFMASANFSQAPGALNLELRMVHEDPFRQILPGQPPCQPGIQR